MAMVCSVAAPSSSPAAAASAVETHIPCLNSSGSRYLLKKQPVRCAIFSYEGSFGGGTNLAQIRWNSWGGARAHGRGIEKGFHLPPQHIRVRIVAYRPVQACGNRVYSRIASMSRNGTTRVPLHVCGGPSQPPFRFGFFNSIP